VDTPPQIEFVIADAVMSPARLLHAYLVEAKLESIRLLRTPAFVVPTLLFPLLFYALFGLVIFHSTGRAFGTPEFLLTNYCAFGAMAPGLFGFGISLAVEREQGILLLKRALPMPPAAHLLAKMLMAGLFVAIVVASLITAGTLFGQVQLSSGKLMALAVITVLGVLPFCAIGFYIGTLATGQSAPAIANMIYLPMSFLSGVWVPLAVLPKVLQSLAPVWPTYHLVQLIRAAVGMPQTGNATTHVVVLAAITAIFTVLAVRRLVRVG
jgi:ABC-2 type transport system permease protein